MAELTEDKHWIRAGSNVRPFLYCRLNSFIMYGMYGAKAWHALEINSTRLFFLNPKQHFF